MKLDRQCYSKNIIILNFKEQMTSTYIVQIQTFKNIFLSPVKVRKLYFSQNIIVYEYSLSVEIQDFEVIWEIVVGDTRQWIGKFLPSKINKTIKQHKHAQIKLKQKETKRHLGPNPLVYWIIVCFPSMLIIQLFSSNFAN